MHRAIYKDLFAHRIHNHCFIPRAHHSMKRVIVPKLCKNFNTSRKNPPAITLCTSSSRSREIDFFCLLLLLCVCVAIVVAAGVVVVVAFFFVFRNYVVWCLSSPPHTLTLTFDNFSRIAAAEAQPGLVWPAQPAWSGGHTGPGQSGLKILDTNQTHGHTEFPHRNTTRRIVWPLCSSC